MSRFVKPYLNQNANLGTTLLDVVTATANPTDFPSTGWTEAIASTSDDWGGFRVQYAMPSEDRAIMHVAVGSSGNEVRIASFPLTLSATDNPQGQFDVDIAVPAGSRISVNVSSVSAATVYYGFIPKPAANYATLTGFTRLDCGPINFSGSFSYGASSGWSGTQHVKTSWVEMSDANANSGNNLLNGDSIGNAYKVLGFVECAIDSAVSGDRDIFTDIAYGEAGSETLIVGDDYVRSNSAEERSNFTPLWVPWNRPAGDRISFRAQCGQTGGDQASRYCMVGYI